MCICAAILVRGGFRKREGLRWRRLKLEAGNAEDFPGTNFLFLLGPAHGGCVGRGRLLAGGSIVVFSVKKLIKWRRFSARRGSRRTFLRTTRVLARCRKGRRLAQSGWAQ